MPKYVIGSSTIEEFVRRPRHKAFSVSCSGCSAPSLDGLDWRTALGEALGHECPGEALDVAAARVSHPTGRELLTQEEHDCLMVLGEAASIYCKQIVGDEPHGVHDRNEFVAHIHDLQARVMAQAAARAYPDQYRLAGGTPPGS